MDDTRAWWDQLPPATLITIELPRDTPRCLNVNELLLRASMTFGPRVTVRLAARPREQVSSGE